MVYAKFPKLRHGINPSPLYNLRTNNVFVGRQKLDLIKTRIFGKMIGGTMTSGLKKLRKTMGGQASATYYDGVRTQTHFPYFEDPQIRQEKIIKYEQRKQRILMRGIKLGKLSGGLVPKVMGGFDQKKR